MNNCLYLGNLDAKRDWGHAKDYVEIQWLMLQQEKPDDFVIATGKQYSVRDFVDAAAKELGIILKWEGRGVEEIGIVDSVTNSNIDGIEGEVQVKTGDIIVRVDPRYFRPTEVDALLGDPSKAKKLLGWAPKISFEELVAEMVRHDINESRRDALCQSHGFRVNNYYE